MPPVWNRLYYPAAAIKRSLRLNRDSEWIKKRARNSRLDQFLSDVKDTVTL